MGRGHSQRGGHGEVPTAEAKVLDFLLSESSLTPFRLSFTSHEKEMIDTHGGERIQQEKANTEPSTVLGDT